MAVPALSLVGFMDQAQAVQHLANDCIPANADPAALIAEWSAARVQLGAPMQNAGQPGIAPLPAAANAHIATLIGPAGGFPPGVAVSEVEIEPLLAFQFTVDKNRSAHHCAGLSTPPTLQELLDLALPLVQQAEQFTPHPGTSSILLKARSLNLRTLVAGFINTQLLAGEQAQYLGVRFGVAPPFVTVARLNGQCFLLNGFHRTVGARQAGATHIPCLLRDIQSAAELGIIGNMAAFQLPLLHSADPPTVGHFTQGRAWDVTFREFWRFINVSWSEYAIPID